MVRNGKLAESQRIIGIASKSIGRLSHYSPGAVSFVTAHAHQDTVVSQSGPALAFGITGKKRTQAVKSCSGPYLFRFICYAAALTDTVRQYMKLRL